MIIRNYPSSPIGGLKPADNRRQTTVCRRSKDYRSLK